MCGVQDIFQKRSRDWTRRYAREALGTPNSREHCFVSCLIRSRTYCRYTGLGEIKKLHKVAITTDHTGAQLTAAHFCKSSLNKELENMSAAHHPFRCCASQCFSLHLSPHHYYQKWKWVNFLMTKACTHAKKYIIETLYTEASIGTVTTTPFRHLFLSFPPRKIKGFFVQ